MEHIVEGGDIVLMDTGERLVRTAYFLCMWTGRRVVPGERYRKRKSWSGWDFAPVVWCSVPSPVHVHDEVMRDPGPLTNSGQMERGLFPAITLQQSALELLQLLHSGERIITGVFSENT